MKNENKEFTANKIREKYEEKQVTDIDVLCAIDKKASRPANVFAYIFGSVSAVIMGAGMSLIMTDIASKVGIPHAFGVGMAVGVIGMVLAIINYPIYKGILKSRRKKYSAEILELSEKIING